MATNIRTRVTRAWRALWGTKAVPASYLQGGGGYVGSQATWATDTAEQVLHYQHWVYAAVRAISQSVAKLRLSLYKQAPNGEEEKVAGNNHPVQRLLRDINPLRTSYYHWDQTVQFLELTGNAYWVIYRDEQGTPIELWTLPPQYMHVVASETTIVSHYTYKRGGKVVTLPKQDVIHLLYPNPTSQYYGAGPLQAAAYAVDTIDDVKNAQTRSMRRAMLPGLLISVDGELPESESLRLRTQLDELYSGTDKSGRALILGESMRAAPFTVSPREMDFLETTRLSREEILGIFGVPPACCGNLDKVPLASAYAALQIFEEMTLKPKARLIEDQLNQDLLEPNWPGYVLRYEEVVRSDRDFDLKEANAAFDRGNMTRNEYRAAIRELPPILGPQGEERTQTTSTTSVTETTASLLPDAE